MAPVNLCLFQRLRFSEMISTDPRAPWMLYAELHTGSSLGGILCLRKCTVETGFRSLKFYSMEDHHVCVQLVPRRCIEDRRWSIVVSMWVRSGAGHWRAGRFDIITSEPTIQNVGKQEQRRIWTNYPGLDSIGCQSAFLPLCIRGLPWASDEGWVSCCFTLTNLLNRS